MPSNDTQNIYSTPFDEGTPNPIPATRISYDGTESGLSATNVQAAIDEVVGDIPEIPATYDAEDITYDNTMSGLTATNAQAAIDEVAGEVANLTAEDIAYVNTESGLTATDAQAAIDEVAGIAASKMQYIAVQEATSIFDLIQNADGSRIYASYAPRFTNGADDLTTLLGVSQYARVEIFCYSKYLAVIRVVNTDGIFAIAYLDAGSTTINFMKVTTTGNSVVTVTQST